MSGKSNATHIIIPSFRSVCCIQSIAGFFPSQRRSPRSSFLPKGGREERRGGKNQNSAHYQDKRESPVKIHDAKKKKNTDSAVLSCKKKKMFGGRQTISSAPLNTSLSYAGFFFFSFFLHEAEIDLKLEEVAAHRGGQRGVHKPSEAG